MSKWIWRLAAVVVIGVSVWYLVYRGNQYKIRGDAFKSEYMNLKDAAEETIELLRLQLSLEQIKEQRLMKQIKALSDQADANDRKYRDLANKLKAIEDVNKLSAPEMFAENLSCREALTACDETLLSLKLTLAEKDKLIVVVGAELNICKKGWDEEAALRMLCDKDLTVSIKVNVKLKKQNRVLKVIAGVLLGYVIITKIGG